MQHILDFQPTKQNNLLGLFRSHYAVNHLLLLGYIFIIRFHIFFVTAPAEKQETTWLFQQISSLIPNSFFVNVLTIILMWIQAVLINNVVNNHKLSRENSVLPGLWYVLIFSLVPATASFHPLLLANTFLILGFVNVIESTKQVDIRHYLFNAGLFFTIAAFVYTPYIVMLLPGFLGFYVFKSLKPSGNLQFIVGILTGFILIFGSYYIITGQIHAGIYLHFLKPDQLFIMPEISVLVFFGLYLFGLAYSLFYYPELIFKKNIQTRKKIETAYLVTLFTAVTVILFFDNQIGQIAILAFPLGTLIGIQTAENKSILFSEILHLIFVGGLIYIQFLS